MSRALRQALEDAQVRLPEVKEALAAPRDPAYLAEEARLLAVVEPLRAQVAEAERRLDVLRDEAAHAEQALTALQVSRRARYSRREVGSAPLVVPALVLIAFLVIWALVSASALPTWALLALGAVAAGALGFYLRLRVLPE